MKRALSRRSGALTHPGGPLLNAQLGMPALRQATTSEGCLPALHSSGMLWYAVARYVAKHQMCPLCRVCIGIDSNCDE